MPIQLVRIGSVAPSTMVKMIMPNEHDRHMSHPSPSLSAACGLSSIVRRARHRPRAIIKATGRASDPFENQSTCPLNRGGGRYGQCCLRQQRNFGSSINSSHALCASFVRVSASDVLKRRPVHRPDRYLELTLKVAITPLRASRRAGE